MANRKGLKIAAVGLSLMMAAPVIAAPQKDAAKKNVTQNRAPSLRDKKRTRLVEKGQIRIAPTVDADYNFRTLETFDYEEMELIVRKAVGPQTLDELEREPKVRDGLRLVLSRRNNDGKRSALFSNLQSQLPEPFFFLSVHRVAEEAIKDIKNQDLRIERRATSMLVLENLMSEVQPRAKDYIQTLELISQANIEVDSKLASFRRLEGMDFSASPSGIAASLVEKAKSTPSGDSTDGIVARNKTPDLIE